MRKRSLSDCGQCQQEDRVLTEHNFLSSPKASTQKCNQVLLLSPTPLTHAAMVVGPTTTGSGWFVVGMKHGAEARLP